ncbi:molybdopterin-binding protein [Pontibacter sp. E15-1]|uniref:molybdenum cofactor synthesis domain-containing protein n=1 Tax=Pontibacter sp. E15-1 TaxID=2919918 RepID=UPI001F4FDDE9|nr:molybdenum cofactor synthesis domain-containing protein [Pontibacter sp. E15-1]MCJ8166583.1 molybdopterin-binding protein [Pontibacter sp. E15-1]
MHDLTHHTTMLRSARAVGVLFCSKQTVETFRAHLFSAECLFEVARAAGFLGAKATPQLLPGCHAATLDSMELSFEFLDGEQHAAHFPEEVLQRTGIVILGEAKSIGRAGVEMQVLTAVTVAALEMLDKLRPRDAQLEIGSIRLLEANTKKGKSVATSPTCAVLVCSDAKASGKRNDNSGQLIRRMLEEAGASVPHFAVVPAATAQIQEQLRAWVAADVPFIFTTGGTGLGTQGDAVTAVEELLEKRAEGIVEAMRCHGQQRTPLAMLSRGVAGTIGNTLVVTLPGSTSGAREALEALLPAVFHARRMMRRSS